MPGTVLRPAITGREVQRRGRRPPTPTYERPHGRASAQKGAGVPGPGRRSRDKRIIVLSGRPYHMDPEINHGIDKLICVAAAAVVIAEDSRLRTWQTKFRTRTC